MDVETLTADPEEQAMRDMGHEADVSQGRPIEEPQSATPPEPRAPGQETEQPQETQPPEMERIEQKPDSSETEPKEPQQPRQPVRDPVTGKFQRPEKPETEYSRAQKEQERKDRSWQALQAEKEQFRMMQSQYAEQQRMAQLEATRQQYQPLKKDGLTAQEYYDGSKVFYRDGDFENAYKAYTVAQDMFHAERQRAEQMKGVEAEYQWRAGIQAVAKVEPDVLNPDTPIGGHMERIIAQNPWIYHVPQGFRRAAEVAHMLTKMDSISELQDENIKLRAELEKYQRKSMPAKGGYASPRYGEKDFDDMNLEEMESHLKGLTAEADTFR